MTSSCICPCRYSAILLLILLLLFHVSWAYFKISLGSTISGDNAMHAGFACKPASLWCRPRLQRDPGMCRIRLFVESRPVKGAVSPIILSEPKCLSFIQSAYVLSGICNPFPYKPSIVFSHQKPFCSQPNYSSWLLDIFGCLFRAI